MVNYFKGRGKKVGLPPGTIIYPDKKPEHPVRLTIFNYDQSDLEEKATIDWKEALEYAKDDKMEWVNCDGLQNAVEIEQLCAGYGIHPLTIEDILTTEQRPKVEDNPDYIFLVIKMLAFDEENRIRMEQVSLVLGKNYVLSFQEREGDTFDPVRRRLRVGKGRIRKGGPDYLFYALIDTIVDHYFVILEKLGDRLEDIEEEMLTDPDEDTLNRLHVIKKEVINVRRSVWPLREVILKLEREELKLIRKENRIYFRDVYDHTIQVIETVETFRDMTSGMIDLYQSTISNRMNEVMKTLTLIATIFIPLTFIAGIYGMNFKYMPELEWKYGYFMVWGLSFGISAALIVFFKRKKWL